MICSKCNYNNLDDANFCAKCGIKLDKSKIVNLSKSKINKEEENVNKEQNNDTEVNNDNNYIDPFEIFLKEQISIQESNAGKYQENKNHDYYNERKYEEEQFNSRDQVSSNEKKPAFSKIGKIVVGVLAVLILLTVVKTVMSGIGKVAENTQPSSVVSSDIASEDNLTPDEDISNDMWEGENLDSNNNEDQQYSQDYVIPDSSEKILTYSDIEGLSKKEINYAKNEIYAKNGRKFDSQELQAYFNSKSWYNGVIDPEDFNEETMLSDIEYKNVIFLSEREHSM